MDKTPSESVPPEPVSEPPTSSRRRFWLRLAVYFGILIVMFCLDRPVYEFLHENYNGNRRTSVPDYLKFVTRVLRSMEDWGETVYILAVVVIMWQLDRQRRGRLVALAMAALITAGVVEVVKRGVGRKRPDIAAGETHFHGPLAKVAQRASESFQGEAPPGAVATDRSEDAGTEPDAAHWLSSKGDYQSFPSGHTAAGASYSGSLAAFYPPARGVCIAMAIGCGANRVWKERHFLSDCWASGVLAFWFAFTLPRFRWMQRLMAWFDRRFSDAAPSQAIVPLARSSTEQPGQLAA